ncbi:peptidyl-prolyl cis-trans isomerase FKBP2 [Drosophila bipectinata]|uniref:peptidyl-prolyl cis-trans isomerase FKBP2 n=1 Tax=Drosophila bipectinata TaxID=42026 RepID=UPI001C89D735|nr:peptidyl-prolyl cis-trans isomerase FKBP2 [Drosophila bipectinata]
MKIACLFLISAFVAVAVAEPKVTIGVKKRVENCTRKAKSGDMVHVHYKGSLQDGTEFDSSHKRGTPFSFTLGAKQVIKGWDQGLLGMCEGEQRKLTIPPESGYGSSGAGGGKIPPNAVLIFDVEMVKIEPRPGSEEL